MLTRQKKSYLFALVTVCFWSTIASASKLSLSQVSPAELLLYSCLVSIVVLFLILVVQNKFYTIAQVKAKEIGISAFYGFLNPFAYYLVLFAAYDMLPAQQAQIINYTWAITLTILSIPLLGQKVSRIQWIAILVSYIGVLVIATKGELLALNFENPKGVGLALLSTVIWALYWIFNTKDERDPVVGLFLNFLFALPYTLVYIFYTEGFRILPVRGYLGATYIGVFEMGLAFVLWLTAMKMTESTARIANLIFISPLISLFFIHHLVGEPIYVSTVVGLVFVMAGLGIQALAKEE